MDKLLEVLKAFFSGLSEKEKKVMYVTAFIVFVALFDRIIIGPFSAESDRLTEKINNQVALTSKNIKLLQYKDRILAEDVARKDFYIPSGQAQEELIASFLSEVEGVAKTSGIAISNINTVTVSEKEGYKEFSLIIECSGKMRDMLDFFYGIDNSPKPLRMASFDMSVKNRDDYEVKCTVTVIKLIVSRAEMSLAADALVPDAPVVQSNDKTVFITEKIALE
ncbi:MAG: type 4a pilus biogenesis protein PilO [Candidatus Omnitrophica bacterium]|nr:type 4a pilus biogenesis protein PilO [Candidatus Omnitrophota bacterium]MDD5488749.1 type 4a pilus biogenesis protein PilO [Candidatus Omnitrophota bacterium]